MTDDRWQRIEKLFQGALERAPAERTAFLDRECDDPEIRAEVDSLLLHDRAASDAVFLPQGLSTATTVALDDPNRTSSDPLIGSRVGPYQILELISARGGMGVVYLAEQIAPVRRRVALKLIKLGMDTKEVLARFEAERQALALMDHPHIAMVFDAGEMENGRPYFVMEYVPGVPLTEYADSHRLTTRERLALFRQVCDAIEHAHYHGVIHRDIKPSNTLVSVVGDKPLVKVIDFGVAKAVNQRLTERTLFTEHGRIVGTPEYMSPEQAQVTALGIDTRTDVYSLGVLLYELLTDSLPFPNMRRHALDEICRIIREEEPPTPSACLRATATTWTASRARRTNPRSLFRDIRGDLDWVTMKALEKDRTRRYSSAPELSAEVNRFLNDEPVLAGPPSAVYRLRKFAKRHRTFTISAVVVLAALVSAVAVSSYAMWLAIEQRNLARLDRDRAEWESYLSKIALVESTYRSREWNTSRAVLRDAPERYRNWEWWYLANTLDQSVGQRIFGRQTTAVDFASRSGLCAIGLKDGSLCMLGSAIATSTPLWTAPPHDEIGSVAFSSRGDLVAAGHTDGTVRVFDARTGRLETTISAHPAGDRHVAVSFARDGLLLATGSTEGTAKLWRTDTWEETGRLDTEIISTISAVQFAPEGGLLAIAGWPQSNPDGKSSGAWVMLWSASTREFVHRLPQPGSVLSVAFSPDGRTIATGTLAEGSLPLLTLWDTTTRRLQHTVVAPDGITTLAWSPGGKHLAVGLWNGDVAILDPERAIFVTVLVGHGSYVDGLTFLSETDLASVSQSLRLWDLDLAQRPAGFGPYDAGVKGMAFSPDGSMLVCALDDGTLHLSDARTRKALAAVNLGVDRPTCMALSPDGTLVAVAGIETPVQLWSTLTGDRVASIDLGDAAESWPIDIAFAADDLIAAALSDGRLLVYDLGSKEPRFQIRPPDESGSAKIRFRDPQVASLFSPGFQRVAVSPDGSTLATGSGNGRIQLRSMSDGALRHSFDGHGVWIADLAFAPDGRRLASCGFDGTLRLWEVQSGKALAATKAFEQLPMGVQAVVFSPDGSRIMSGEAGAIRIWESNSLDLVCSLRGHGDIVTSLAFDAKTLRLASASGDGTVRLWDPIPLNAQSDELRRVQGEYELVRPRISAMLKESPDSSRAARILESDAALESVRRTALKELLRQTRLQTQDEQEVLEASTSARKFGRITYGGGSGASKATAVLIDAPTQQAGIDAEYAFLEMRYGARGSGAWQLTSQELDTADSERIFDILTIELTGGGIERVHFDITEFFGKEAAPAVHE